MPCEIWSDPKFFGGAPIFAHVRTEVRKKCQFCDHRALSLCDWPTIRPIRFEPYDAITEGEVLVQTSSPLWRARIEELDRQDEFVHVVATLLKPELGSPESRGSKYPMSSFNLTANNCPMFRVERLSTCDAPCCFRHRRHVGPDKDYCQDHWKSWEQVG